jgi:hypothetical protein
MEKLVETFVVAVIGVGLLVLISFLMSWPVYMLWNGALVGAINGINEITWLQAWGINVLFGMLFKNSSYSKSKD